MPDGEPNKAREPAGTRRHDAASLAGQSSPATESAGHSVPLGHDDRHPGPYTTGPAARASRLASLACLWLAGIGLCMITLIILYQVFMRYVLSASPAWSEQLALYVLVWTVLVAAAAGVREQFHIRIQAGQDALSPRRRKIALNAAHLVTAMIGVFLAIYGFQLVGALVENRLQACCQLAKRGAELGKGGAKRLGCAGQLVWCRVEMRLQVIGAG